MIAQREYVSERKLADVVLMRAAFLDRPERALLEQVFDRGVEPKQIAAVTGTTARCIQRRIKQLVEHLTDPHVLYILQNHKKWDHSTRHVALRVFVRRHALRRAAEDLDLSLHAVRLQVQKVKGLIQAAGEK